MNDPGNPFSNAHFSQILATPFNNETLCDASSWLAEQAIDVQAVHSMAGHAHILYVGAQNCLDTGLFNAEQKVIDNHLADVVTNSWGDDAGDLLDDVATKTAFDDLFMHGRLDRDHRPVLLRGRRRQLRPARLLVAGLPGGQPVVTAVGGTSLKIGKNGQQTGQLGWATGRSLQVHGQRRGQHSGVHQGHGEHLAAGVV